VTVGVLQRWRRVVSRAASERPPAGAIPALDPGERMTAWAPTTDGGVVVVTSWGLWLPGWDRRLGWHEVHKATWEDPVLTIIPAEEVEPGVVADREPVPVQLAHPRNVPPEVRTRVTRSVAYTAHHRLPGGGVRVLGRRVPGRDGLAWAVRYDPGTPLDDRVTDRAAEILGAARQSAGPPGDLR